MKLPLEYYECVTTSTAYQTICCFGTSFYRILRDRENQEVKSSTCRMRVEKAIRRLGPTNGGGLSNVWRDYTSSLSTVIQGPRWLHYSQVARLHSASVDNRMACRKLEAKVTRISGILQCSALNLHKFHLE